MSFLSKISSIRKSIPVAQTKPKTETTKQKELYQAPTLLPKNYTREEDPAVRRLKERRQQELLKRGELSKKASAAKKSSAPRRRTKKDTDEDNRTETRFKKRPSGGAISSSSSRPTTVKKTEPLKKMSFEELMKQAENNAQTGGSKNSAVLPKKSSPNLQSRSRPHISKPGFKTSDRRKRGSSQEPVKPIPKPQQAQQQSHIKEPKPLKLAQPQNNFAKPNELIRRRLELKKQTFRSRRSKEDEYESDMDDFIEDDEAEEMSALGRDPGYDRDEIWAMFNRGKRRSDYAIDDDEEDDMEANEREIIEEEERARKMAKLEDKREEEWLRKHEEEKKRRKRTR
ncbi:SPT2 (YER161C) [Zygosaccharomyces parabailii]|nr:SPT2 (YER161C) [Zygosaccharomyces parabailii]